MALFSFINSKNFVKKIIREVPFLEKRRQIRSRSMIDTGKISKKIDELVQNGMQKPDSRQCVKDVIVSLTSFPARMKHIKFTLYSLVMQTVKPARIILWLSEKEFSGRNVPEDVKVFERFGVEIVFTRENFRSYNKLVFSLAEFPDYSIVTADDDLYYWDDWLEKLIRDHRNYPTEIIAHRVHNISFTGKKLDGYNAWNGPDRDSSYLNFLTGCGGVLYPPKSLYPDATNKDLFTRLCPLADDIWFYVMALLNGRKIRHIPDGYQRLVSFDVSLHRDFKHIPQLQSENVYNNRNDVQLKAVLEHYGLYEKFYEKFSDSKTE